MDMRQFDKGVDEIDTFNSYIGKIKIEEDVLSIFFFNIGVSNHILNEDNDLKYIDRSILVFRGVLSFTEDYSLDIVVGKGLKSFYFGGYHMTDGVHKEFQVLCSDASLKVPDDFHMSGSIWDPYTMPKDIVQRFLEVR